VIVDFALSIKAAFCSEARVLAFFLNTCKVDRAFRICGAFWSWWKPAVSGGGTDVPVGTGTPWSVVDDLTNGGGGARVAHGTWIDALLILACCPIWAFLVVRAANSKSRLGWLLSWVACNGGVSLITWQADALALVVLADTSGIGSTAGQPACVYTAAQVAGFGNLAFIVVVTLGTNFNLGALAVGAKHRSLWADTCN